MTTRKTSKVPQWTEEARREGLELKYQGTDEDLPSNFWPETEETFWENLKGTLKTHT